MDPTSSLTAAEVVSAINVCACQPTMTVYGRTGGNHFAWPQSVIALTYSREATAKHESGHGKTCEKCEKPLLPCPIVAVPGPEEFVSLY